MRVALMSAAFCLIGVATGAWAAFGPPPFGGPADLLIPAGGLAGLWAGVIIWAARPPQVRRHPHGGVAAGLVVGVFGHVLCWMMYGGREVLWLGQPVRIMEVPGPRPVGPRDLLAAAILAVPCGLLTAAQLWPSVLVAGVVGAAFGRRSDGAVRDDPAS